MLNICSLLDLLVYGPWLMTPQRGEALDKPLLNLLKSLLAQISDIQTSDGDIYGGILVKIM